MCFLTLVHAGSVYLCADIEVRVVLCFLLLSHPPETYLIECLCWGPAGGVILKLECIHTLFTRHTRVGCLQM